MGKKEFEEIVRLIRDARSKRAYVGSAYCCGAAMAYDEAERIVRFVADRAERGVYR